MRFFIAVIFCFSVAFCVLGDASFAEAEKAKNDTSRIWVDSSGKHRVAAALLDVTPDRIVIQRDSDGKMITVEIAELCNADRDYVKLWLKRVKAEERLTKRVMKLNSLIAELRPSVQKYAASREEGETTLQTDERRRAALAAIKDAIHQRSFVVMAKVADLKEVEIERNPFAEIARGAYLDKKQRPVEKKYLIDLLEYVGEAHIPDTVEVSLLETKFGVNDVICLDCSIGDVGKSIGRIEIGLPKSDLNLICSIISVDVPDQDAAVSVMTEQTVNVKHQRKFAEGERSRREFRSDLQQGAARNAFGVYIISKEQLFAEFGHPSETATIADMTYWTYECTDGRLVLYLPSYSDKSPKIAIKRIDDF